MRGTTEGRGWRSRDAIISERGECGGCWPSVWTHGGAGPTADPHRHGVLSVTSSPTPCHPPCPLRCHTFAYARMALFPFLLLKSTHPSRPSSNHPSLRRQTCLESPLLCFLQPAKLVPTLCPNGHSRIQVEVCVILCASPRLLFPCL